MNLNSMSYHTTRAPVRILYMYSILWAAALLSHLLPGPCVGKKGREGGIVRDPRRKGLSGGSGSLGLAFNLPQPKRYSHAIS